MKTLEKKLMTEELRILYASEIDPFCTTRFHDYIAFGDWTDSSEGPCICFHGGTPFSAVLKNAPIMRFNIYGECFITPSSWMNKDNCPHVFCEEYINKLIAFVQCNLPVFFLVYHRHIDKLDALDYFRGMMNWDKLLSSVHDIPEDLYIGIVSCENAAQLHNFCVKEGVYGKEEYNPQKPLLCGRLRNLLRPVFEMDIGMGIIHKYNGSAEIVRIPEEIVTIAESAFSDHPEIKTIIFPDTLEGIEREAFKGCSGIEAITFPPNLEWVESYAFGECTKLHTVCITNTDSECYIDADAFSDCTALREVHLGYWGTPEGDQFPNCPQALRYCAAGSYAERYAKENGIPYVSK